MTEDEAKTKWCCSPKVMADAVLSKVLDSQRAPVPDGRNGLCIASACMAWRWMAWVEGVAVSYGPGYGDKTNGFCGLAGKP
jgi:hypothetical protein